MARNDNSLLEAALVGYKAEQQRIEAAIADIQKRLGRSKASGVGLTSNGARRPKKHRISAEGRARIAEAQRRRWAAAKKQGH